MNLIEQIKVNDISIDGYQGTYYLESPEWVRVIVDSEDKVLAGIQADGTVEWGAGVPTPVREYVELRLINALLSKVDKEENKSLIDSSISESMYFVDNPEYIQVTTDREDKIVMGIKENGAVYIPILENDSIDLKVDDAIERIEESVDEALSGIGAIADYFSDVDDSKEGRSEIITDLEGKIISYRDTDGVKHENVGIETKYFNSYDVYYRNQHKNVSLLNACRANLADFSHTKDLQLLELNDSHTDSLAVSHAVELTNRFSTIDGLIHCGDMTYSTYTPEYLKHFINDIMSKCKKPWFLTVGNHDAGTTLYVNYAPTHENLYNDIIKPMVDAGCLAKNEYQVNKSYYYHDFLERKIRLIVTYDYDSPIDSINDLKQSKYWEPVEYDESYPNIIENHQYIYDSNNETYVNCGSYDRFSFRLKETVKTSTGQYTQPLDETEVEGYPDGPWTRPAFKIGRGVKVIREEQANWFINTLKTTPYGYGIIVASHIPASDLFIAQRKKFTSSAYYESYPDGYQYGKDSVYPMVNIKTDIWCDIVQAFIDRTNINENIVMCADKAWTASDATYLNIHTDAEENYAYNINANFSNVSKSCFFISFIGGHHHSDIVYRHPVYKTQWAFHGVTARSQYSAADMARSGIVDSIAYDNFTAISFAKNRIALVRIGNDETINGEKRDYEVIDTRIDLEDKFEYSAETATAEQTGTLINAPILINSESLNVTFTSSDLNVATIDNNGVVDVLANGVTTIRARFKGNDTYLPKYTKYVLNVNL